MERVTVQVLRAHVHAHPSRYSVLFFCALYSLTVFPCQVVQLPDDLAEVSVAVLAADDATSDVTAGRLGGTSPDVTKHLLAHLGLDALDVYNASTLDANDRVALQTFFWSGDHQVAILNARIRRFLLAAYIEACAETLRHTVDADLAAVLCAHPPWLRAHTPMDSVLTPVLRAHPPMGLRAHTKQDRDISLTTAQQMTVLLTRQLRYSVHTHPAEVLRPHNVQVFAKHLSPSAARPYTIPVRRGTPISLAAFSPFFYFPLGYSIIRYLQVAVAICERCAQRVP